ncbi:glycosyltransferase [Hymenobacter sp. DG25B]|uniref:glycosyltransferase n=1 Tax=Hymenobacter sp. DG25B TaxID=1385664 RepID=UPI0018CDCEDE|nr:glycosyltransferase [Hymenobacter sp. DG25B]
MAPNLFQEGSAPAELAVAALQLSTPPHPALLASIIIPAKNEAETLPATLAALATQLDLAGKALAPELFEILVLANNCADATAAAARRFAAAHPALAVHVVEIQLPPAEAHIGRARRLLMDAACRRLEEVQRPQGIIVSTDADTIPAPTWLAATLAEIAAGADAVGGRILTPGMAPVTCTVRRSHLRDAAYRLLCARLESLLDPDPADPWPRHHQFFGGSLALTPAAYRRVGGLPVLPYLEDEALRHALRRHDLRVRHSPQVRVHTSDRQVGRVAVGLSWQLREWARLSAAGTEPMVESSTHLYAHLKLRGKLRRLWQSREHVASCPTYHAQYAELATALACTTPELMQQLLSAETFGQLWEEVAAQRLPRYPAVMVPLGQALLKVRQLLRTVETTPEGLSPADPAGM